MAKLLKIAEAKDVPPGQAAAFTIEGLKIALFNVKGTYYAIGDTCTHGEISLSEGFVEDETLECWAHGSQFSLVTGAPLNLPAYEPVPVFQVELIGGDVYLDPTVTKEI